MISTAAMIMIGDAIREAAADPRTAADIRIMHQTGLDELKITEILARLRRIRRCRTLP